MLFLIKNVISKYSLQCIFLVRSAPHLVNFQIAVLQSKYCKPYSDVLSTQAKKMCLGSSERLSWCSCAGSELKNPCWQKARK